MPSFFFFYFKSYWLLFVLRAIIKLYNKSYNFEITSSYHDTLLIETV